MRQQRVADFSLKTDEQVMLEFQSGNELAFNELEQRFRERLYHFLIKYTHQHEDTEDLVQETFIRLYRSRNAYEPVARFSTWLFTIASNLMRTHFRKHGKASFTYIDDETKEDANNIQLVECALNPEELTHASLTSQIIQSKLAQLGADYSDLLYLRELKEFSYEEIASAVNLPMGTVKSRINRGRTKLQEIFLKMNDKALTTAA